MIGLVLLYVGGVLFLNGIWILGEISDNEIGVMNVFAGLVGILGAFYLAFVKNDPASIAAGAEVLLFAFTYLWVAWNRWNGADGRGLGWYCLFVAVIAAPTGYLVLSGASSTWEVWLGADWLAWAVLWFLFWLMLYVKAPVVKLTGWVTVLEGIFTAWLPAYLLLMGLMK